MELCVKPRLPERIDWLFDWLYPPRCRACRAWIAGRDAEYFCARCREHIHLVAHPLCDICGRPFPDAAGGDHTCGDCLEHRPQFMAARAWACYPREDDHPLRAVVQKFKYRRKVSLGKPLGRLMARGCQEFLAVVDADVIVPVPLYPKRLRWRGFNQSVLLGREIARIYGVPLDPWLLRRQRETAAQTQLPENERRRNVSGAFALNPDRPVKDKRILLVDDVYTSGATVNECSRTLKRGGAREVYVLTLARAVY